MNIYTKYEQFVKRLSYIKKLLFGHELPINDPLRLRELGKIHLRMHAGKLNHGILKPLAISIGSVVGELFFCFLEKLDLLSKLPLHLAQLDITLGGPLLQLGHPGLRLIYLLLQFNHFVAER